MTLPLAVALVLTGCSGPADESAKKTPAAEQTQSADSASPAEQTEAASSAKPTKDPGKSSTNVEDLPDYLKPYPDSTVLSSSQAKAESGDNKGKLEQVSLVMRAKAKPKDIFKFYSKTLGKAGFESYGDEVKTKSAQVVNFRHEDNDGLLVVTIAEDPSDKANAIVTVGGNVVP